MAQVVTGQALADRVVSKVRTPAIPYRLGGRSEAGTDCINLPGWCLDELDARTLQRGSNRSWQQDYAWRGTLAEAVAQGRLAPGALLFIDYASPPGSSAGTQGKMDHAGVYVGFGYMLTTQEGKPADVVHASQSRGGVYPSTLQNAWTHVLLPKGVDFAGICDEDAPAAVVLPAQLLPGQARITTLATGLRMRKKPDRSGAPICEVPKGAIVAVLDTVPGWVQVRHGIHVGWCCADYLEMGGRDGD